MRDRTAGDAQATVAFSIPADHPALPGHFPGAPVVPGALLLAEGLRRLEAALGVELAGRRIECAKFLRPVGGGLPVTAVLTTSGAALSRVEFSVAGQAVAEMNLAAGSPASSGAPRGSGRP